VTTQDIARDRLTGLVIRSEFESRVEAALKSAQADNQRHVVCHLDLDRFRGVNHACGHNAGDQMLIEIASRLRDTVGESGIVARIGGDEFGILLQDCPIEKAREIADSIVREVAEYRFNWDNKVLGVGVSIGLVELSRESGSLEDELRAVDIACARSKETDAHVNVYSAREEAEAGRRDQAPTLQRMQAVLNYGPPELETRPIGLADARSYDAPGLAVVFRLKDERGAAVAWSELLCAAERLRLLPRVDRWVVKTALAALSHGSVHLPAGRSLVIRLSGQSLGDEDFLQFVVDCFDRTAVTPDRICFEVTEDSLISNSDCARLFIAVMHGMGCRFGLGGVGRGPTLFESLNNLRFDYLKFDGDLIRNLASDRDRRAAVTALIERARFLGYRVVAGTVDDPGVVDDVVAVEINWEMEGEKVLDLMVNADGSIHRQGDGTPSGASCFLEIGQSDQPLLRNILKGLVPELLTIGGVIAMEPIAGKLCKLTVSFGRMDDGGNAFEVWYGSASTGPHPAIAAFVRNAIEQTNDWYQQLRADPSGS
jgi:diguanylate cyclase (GGDEF)-like protein